MTHTDTDIAEILQRFDENNWFVKHYYHESKTYDFDWFLTSRESPEDVMYAIKDFITRECLALKKKWEREHFDNQDERG